MRLLGHSCQPRSSGRSRLGALCWHQLLFVAGMVVIAILAASCSSSEPPPASQAQRASPEAASPPADEPPPAETTDETPPEAEEPRAPKELRFEVPALSGGTIRGADFAGKDLVVWFWAPW